MSKILLRFLVCCLISNIFSSCQDKSINTNSEQQSNIDSSIFTVIRFQTADKWMLENVKPANLSDVELLQVDSVLRVCVGEYNKKQLVIYDSLAKNSPQSNLQLSDFVINIKKYKRQYIPVINSKGDKEVWVNCFCDTWDKDWRNEILIVHDGGNCYFNLIINLSELSYRVFIVNGEA